jgi:hypothetical protein
MTCPLCEEIVDAGHIADRAARVGGHGDNRYAHRECLLRAVLGGIGHLEDHAYWCTQVHDPDGGRTYRQSAILVDEWVHHQGVEAQA